MREGGAQRVKRGEPSELRALLFEWGGQPEAATEAELASPVAEDDSGAAAAAAAAARNQHPFMVESIR